MNAMTTWWHGLQARDRQVLQVGAALAALLLLWGALWLPLAHSREALQRQVIAQTQALAWMRPAAQQLIASGGAGAPSAAPDGRSLLARVDAGARAAGLAGALVSVEPQGPHRVRANFTGADFDTLASWLERGAAQDIAVVELSVQRAAAGRVDARALLTEGAR
ncbi:MAG: type II secretion system protein GspM [Xanthomonadaceae bacterium]|nr:type II secretion system protein GspM [Xanthomonadaceae bacterium]